MGSLAYLGAVGVVPVAAEGRPIYRTGSPKLLDRVRAAMRTRHMSGRTEEAYVFWIRRYVLFHAFDLGPKAKRALRRRRRRKS
jgi:hypothetical protein